MELKKNKSNKTTLDVLFEHEKKTPKKSAAQWLTPLLRHVDGKALHLKVRSGTESGVDAAVANSQQIWGFFSENPIKISDVFMGI